MEKETMGTVISVIKQWWLKVNRKPARVHAMDGAAFPHIIKVKYTIDGKDYICRKWIGAGNNVPDKGTKPKVQNTQRCVVGNIRVSSVLTAIARVQTDVWNRTRMLPRMCR